MPKWLQSPFLNMCQPFIHLLSFVEKTKNWQLIQDHDYCKILLQELEFNTMVELNPLERYRKELSKWKRSQPVICFWKIETHKKQPGERGKWHSAFIWKRHVEYSKSEIGFMKMKPLILCKPLRPYVKRNFCFVLQETEYHSLGSISAWN